MAPSISSTTACSAAATSLANKGSPTMAASSARANRLRILSMRRAQAAVSAAPMGRLLVERPTGLGDWPTASPASNSVVEGDRARDPAGFQSSHERPNWERPTSYGLQTERNNTAHGIGP